MAEAEAEAVAEAEVEAVTVTVTVIYKVVRHDCPRKQFPNVNVSSFI